MLIDHEGTIVFKGHPASRDNLEEDLDKLMRKEELTGNGISKRAAAGGQAAAAEFKVDLPEGYNNVDSSTISGEIATWKSANEDLLKDSEIQEAVKSMARVFNVIVFETAYSPSSGSSGGQYTNHRVFVGPQASIDKFSSTIEAKCKGSFEVKSQTRAL